MPKPRGKVHPVHELLVQAIATRTPIAAVYDGLRRIFCPHVFGYTGDRHNCLMYQSGGESRSGLVSGADDNWRCVPVDSLSEVVLAPDEPWITPPNWTVVSQTCVAAVEASIFPSG